MGIVAGGRTGTRIVEELTGEAILNDFVRIADESRTSTLVVEEEAIAPYQQEKLKVEMERKKIEEDLKKIEEERKKLAEEAKKAAPPPAIKEEAVKETAPAPAVAGKSTLTSVPLGVESTSTRP